ncbi:hypothetical protein [Natronomonas marina]|jgi:hypothetical protein|uniref:hypothetical protein n=1 Tax=Natronomonas marina TaxID=2961939 RepID=UPI0020C9EBD0|nr:hypothetical protein [Natronomonas marina]
MTDEKWNHLNRPLGYEIATLLMDAELSFSEIKDNLPYNDVADNELNRILKEEETEADIFTVPKTRGRKKHTLNLQLFSEEDLEKIRARARARIIDNLFEKGPSNPSKDETVESHTDGPNMESRFH